MKIQYDPKTAIPVEIKRLCLPLTISDECPECGGEVEHDYDGPTYLSYPTLNAPERETFGCECGHEWERWIQLDLTVKAVATVPVHAAVSSSKEPQDATSS